MRAQERAVSNMIHDLDEMDRDMALLKKTVRLVPIGWGKATRETSCAPQKKKMTIRLEAEVLDWYRSLGLGYQKRINQVLRAYMHAVISKHIEERRDRDWMDEPI